MVTIIRSLPMDYSAHETRGTESRSGSWRSRSHGRNENLSHFGSSQPVWFAAKFPLRPVMAAFLAGCLGAWPGCGTTKGRLATEQLVMSDAVDHAVAEFDFRPLAGRKVFLDARYVQNVKTTQFVNADYIISSLRQQMMAADCRLQDTPELAEIIVEARVGALGTDSHDVVYGLPASGVVSSAAALVPHAPVIPPIPEISLARRESQLGAAKLAVFAYDRQTRRPIWQSGIAQTKSAAQDVWVFGVGPFQRGSIYSGTQFAGSSLDLPGSDESDNDERDLISYDKRHIFASPEREDKPAPVHVTGFVQPLPLQTQPAEGLAGIGDAAKSTPDGSKEPLRFPSLPTPSRELPTEKPAEPPASTNTRGSASIRDRSP